MSESPTNTMRDFMKTSYGDEKYDKSKELNTSMSIDAQGNDEYNNKIANLNGKESD